MNPLNNIIKPRKGNDNCCVVGCYNTYKKVEGLRLYSFPNRKWEVERRLKWIQAVRRINKDGSDWLPTTKSKICNTHFVGGSKSDDPRHPAYHPTIFPEVYKSRPGKMSMERYNRLYSKKHTASAPKENEQGSSHFFPSELLAGTAVEAVTQTDFPDTRPVLRTVIFCDRDSFNCVGTNIVTEYSVQETRHAEVMTETHNTVSVQSVACGPCQEQDFTSGVQSLFHYDKISNDSELKQLCGVTTSVFDVLYKEIEKRLDSKKSNLKIDSKNRLFMFLMRLRLGLSLAVLARFFLVHETTAGRIFKEILECLLETTKGWLYWPSKQAIKETLPPTFSDYPECRAIIDCTEIRCEKPPSVEQCVFMYSSYKGTHTVKVLIAITPNGYISFISPAYGGKATDAYIVQESGFLNLLQPGDEILADKGFPQIIPDMINKDCFLVMPPFLKGNQFEEKEVQETYKVAKVRIHVERVIQRLKTYHILDKIHVDLLPYLDGVISICAVLTNFQAPIIKIQNSIKT